VNNEGGVIDPANFLYHQEVALVMFRFNKISTVFFVRILPCMRSYPALIMIFEEISATP